MTYFSLKKEKARVETKKNLHQKASPACARASAASARARTVTGSSSVSS